MITRKNKDDMPYNLILIQGVIITIIMLATSTFKTVEDIYTVLIMVETILMFAPYLFLIVAYIKTKRNKNLVGTFSVPGKKVGATIAVVLVTVMTFIAILIPIISLPEGETVLHYETIIISFPLILIALGWAINRYALSKNRNT